MFYRINDQKSRARAETARERAQRVFALKILLLIILNYSPPHAGLAQASGGRDFVYAKQ